MGKLSPGPGLSAEEVAAHQLRRIHRAVVGAVAESGYRGLNVRDVVGRAEISTRAFYEHFGSKEDCFLQTYDLIARRAIRRIIAAQSEERDWRRRLDLVLGSFVDELERDPEAAYLTQVEAYAAGQAAQERAWRAHRVFEGMLVEGLARPPGVAVPPMITEGVVAGVSGVARSCLMRGNVSVLREWSEDLVEWALCYFNPVAAQLAELDRQSVWRDTMLEPNVASPPSADGGVWPASGDRALILNAVAKLAQEQGYATLTVPRIRSAAGVSKRKFDAHFDGVEDCYLVAVEQRVTELLAHASRAQTAARSRPGGVYRAIGAICEHISNDEFLARLCLEAEFPPSLAGTRSRQRFMTAMTELLSDGAVESYDPARPVLDASANAVWSLFHRYAIRDRAFRHRISATLAYLTLAPTVGPLEATAAIRGEQG